MVAQATDALILDAARGIVRTSGPDALTFEAIAKAVGLTKQAVLYWFPNKARLIEALVRPALEAEASAAGAAAGTDGCPHAAIRAIVNALATFHLADLDRFRLMYVAPQIGQRAGREGQMVTTLGRLHPATVEMYDQIAGHLVRSGRFPSTREARRAATAIHTAVLGLILRVAMADALNAPLRRDEGGLVEALLDLIAPMPEPAALAAE